MASTFQLIPNGQQRRTHSLLGRQSQYLKATVRTPVSSNCRRPRQMRLIQLLLKIFPHNQCAGQRYQSSEDPRQLLGALAKNATSQRAADPLDGKPK
ncbi:hypothetical protein J3P85_16350 [Pseudomonas sp. Z1-12]|uniref:hypothetical protein n=1 Tax=Pseudomonas sp. Z1-12 TaxID=2817408 RepID=UPI003DA9670F